MNQDFKTYIAEASVELFCNRKLAEDMRPLMQLRLKMMRSKMSEDLLKKNQQLMKKYWSEIEGKAGEILSDLKIQYQSSKIQGPHEMAPIFQYATSAVREKCSPKDLESSLKVFWEHFLTNSKKI